VIDPLDAWALRRLLTGHDLGDERERLSERFRPLAERLDALPLEARQTALDGFLAGCHDAEGVVLAMADVDPHGPPPASEADEPSDDWPPLKLGGLPPVDPFPDDVLPGVAARLVTEGAEAIGCPSDFLGVPVLAVAGGTIGRSASLMLKGGYFASATIYAGCVGPPSDGKTPALKVAAAAVRRIDEALEAEYVKAVERWQEEAARPGPDGKKQKSPPPPKPRRIDVDDITMEALPLILADNPRGLVMVRDELTSFALGMNQFKAGKGNDRPNALKIWSGDAIKKDRVNHEANAPIRCPYPSLTIVGGLTPDMLGALVDQKGRADGFVDRFLLVYPDPRPVAGWSERGVAEETADEWAALVARLWARPMNAKDGRSVPHVLQFTPEAKALWRVRYDAHAAEMNALDFPPSLRGPWGKLREYAGRLTLTLACMEHAADPTADPAEVPTVDSRIVRNAWRLVAYFKTHTIRVHAAITQGTGVGGGDVVQAIVGWLREGLRSSFTVRDLKQARRWIHDDELDKALSYLGRRNAIRPRGGAEESSKRGRPASPIYDVHPALLGSQNTRNTQNPPGDGHFEDSEYFEYAKGGG
jgi:hypothetical protein